MESASFWEAVLFGWHAKPFGCKRVSFRLLDLDEGGFPSPWSNKLDLPNWSGINYLTAQGFRERAPVKLRAFTVEARVSERPLGPDIEESRHYSPEHWTCARKTLKDAMALIGLIGGLGARSRRGFGSLAVSFLREDEEQPDITALPTSVVDYGKQIKAHLGGARFGGTPPYSALSDKFSCDICASDGDMRHLMNDIGWAFQIYRSYGQRRQRRNPGAGHVHRKTAGLRGNGEVNKTSIDAGRAKNRWYAKAFYADHDQFYSHPRDVTLFDNRSVFGLPHNYGKREVGWDSNALARDEGPKHRRRASPLLFHFHRLQGGTGVFVSSVIPAEFTPAGVALRVKNGPRKRDDVLRTKVINGYVNFALVRGFNNFLRAPAADLETRKLFFTPQTWTYP